MNPTLTFNILTILQMALTPDTLLLKSEEMPYRTETTLIEAALVDLGTMPTNSSNLHINNNKDHKTKITGSLTGFLTDKTSSNNHYLHKSLLGSVTMNGLSYNRIDKKLFLSNNNGTKDDKAVDTNGMQLKALPPRVPTKKFH